MYVKDHMTEKPYTITKDVVISKAVEIMRKNHFHRLPVVDDQGKLIGLVTGGLVKEKSGASSTSLSIYELNYLLSKTEVQDIMITDVKTISQDVFVEVAAQTMLENEISVLPVVDEKNKVIGIITDKDIFQAFVELLGYRNREQDSFSPPPTLPANLLQWPSVSATTTPIWILWQSITLRKEEPRSWSRLPAPSLWKIWRRSLSMRDSNSKGSYRRPNSALPKTLMSRKRPADPAEVIR